ncbi:MAG: hypothetical protein J7M19_05025 [Planctomycetes bacterium]|nr:hypothetical protein [Planctomycetota bacterium]
MTRLLHLLPIIMIIAAVTAALRAGEPGAFAKEFFKACGSLAAGMAGLGGLVFLASLVL